MTPLFHLRHSSVSNRHADRYADRYEGRQADRQADRNADFRARIDNHRRSSTNVLVVQSVRKPAP
jgi:hypothetical protein